jgi:putative nucleotidyltransferase with HDIG domain
LLRVRLNCPVDPQRISHMPPGRETRVGIEDRCPVATLAALSSTIEARDPFARGHASRVDVLAHSLAFRLGLDRQALLRLRLGALLHDIGKLAVPEAVLVKRGALNDVERAQIRRHPGAGAWMLRAIGVANEALPGVLFHHERWDGRGYPGGLAGESIPLEARILAVADAFDAITSIRPYRSARPAANALDELQRCAGSQFDPEIVDVFIAVCLERELRLDERVAAAG